MCKQCTSLHGALDVVCTVHTFAHCTAVRLVVVCTVQEFSRCTEIDCALQCCSVHCSAGLRGRQRGDSVAVLRGARWQRGGSDQYRGIHYNDISVSHYNHTLLLFTVPIQGSDCKDKRVNNWNIVGGALNSSSSIFSSFHHNSPRSQKLLLIIPRFCCSGRKQMIRSFELNFNKLPLFHPHHPRSHHHE